MSTSVPSRLALAAVLLLFCIVAMKEIFHARAPEHWNWEMLWGVPTAFAAALQQLRLVAPATRYMVLALPLAGGVSCIGYRLTQSWICLAIAVVAGVASLFEVRLWLSVRAQRKA